MRTLVSQRSDDWSSRAANVARSNDAVYIARTQEACCEKLQKRLETAGFYLAYVYRQCAFDIEYA